MRIGIDASNLRVGGGITHLRELLGAANPEVDGFEHIVVWGSARTLSQLQDRAWLSRVSVPSLDNALPLRVWWQRFRLRKLANRERCDILFVPGGADASGFRPIVAMSRNLLPFEWRELRRYGWSWTTAKLFLLRFAQKKTLRSADGVVFLTNYARTTVERVTGKLRGRVVTIPHGISGRFRLAPRRAREIGEFTQEAPCRILYVSGLEMYKHQWHVVRAVAALRSSGLPVRLDLCGPSGPGLRLLEQTIRSVDPLGSFVTYWGAVSYDELHRVYAEADIGVFASSCENLPNILLEGMAAGLPFVCSRMGPMPEVLGQAGVYCDPEDEESIAEGLRQVIESSELRSDLSAHAYARAEAFSWEACARATFALLVQCSKSSTSTSQLAPISR